MGADKNPPSDKSTKDTPEPPMPPPSYPFNASSGSASSQPSATEDTLPAVAAPSYATSDRPLPKVVADQLVIAAGEEASGIPRPDRAPGQYYWTERIPDEKWARMKAKAAEEEAAKQKRLQSRTARLMDRISRMTETRAIRAAREAKERERAEELRTGYKTIKASQQSIGWMGSAT